MTSLNDIKVLQAKARALDYTVTLYFNEEGLLDAVWLADDGYGGIYDPLSAAEKMRRLIQQAPMNTNADGTRRKSRGLFNNA
jgi:hypothetical protein